jgi:hypothetical protein
MVTLKGSQTGFIFRFALLMGNSALPRLAVTVMSDMFGDGMYVTPHRLAPYSSLPAQTGEWIYLSGSA